MGPARLQQPKPQFLNQYEAITHKKLTRVADKMGAHVFAKVRLKDVIPVDNTGISNVEFDFALKAHVDFLVTDSDYKPQFCVEFDGPSHRTDQKQIRRDQLKNNLLARFQMPYIRINARYLDDRYRGLDLLTYFVDAWFLSLAFEEAQDAGTIPWDEDFDITFVYSSRTPQGPSWPYWLSLDAQTTINEMRNAGHVAQMCPCYWIGIDKLGNLRCLAWLFITHDRCLVVETGMRHYDFPAVHLSSLLGELAVCELHDSLDSALRDQNKCRSKRALDKRLDYYKRQYEERIWSWCSVE